MRFISPRNNDFPDPVSDFEAAVFSFCREWNAGKAHFMFHSSGSTGKPKSIELSRDQMACSAKLTGAWLSLNSRDIALMALPVEYIAGAMVLVRALELDLDVLLVDPCQNPLLHLGNHQVHLASFVPTQWATILSSSVDLLSIFSNAKGILLGGASLDPELEKRSSALNLPIFHTYGMTETVSHVAFRDVRLGNEIYSLLPGVQIRLNERGCLCISGLMTGQAWVETQDMVQLVDANSFRFLGRADRVINSGGKKIFPDVVEKWVHAYRMAKDWKGDLMMVGIPDQFYGQKAVLFSTIDLDVDKKNQLIDFLKTKIPSEDCPKDIIFISHFELLLNGKIDALKTVALYLERP